jgi:hypothetical protein
MDNHKIFTLGYQRHVKDEKTREILRESLTKGASRTLGICEVMRFMYDVLYDMPPSPERDLLMDMLIDTLSMGKRIVSRLSHYKRKYQDYTGSMGKNLLKVGCLAERQRMREQRV